MNGDVLDQAIGWHLASTRDDMDWDAFTLWLESDPAHRREYDAVAHADAALGHHAADLAARDPGEAPQRRAAHRGWLAGAFAASAAMIAAVFMLAGQGRQQTFATDAAARQIALADGSAIALAPHSRLTMADASGRRIDLAGGAYFAIRHDPARTMEIHAGPLTVEDIGTSFDIQTEGAITRIAVAQGRVTVRSAQLPQAVVLAAGKAMVFDEKAELVQLASVPGQAVGGWRQGELTYADAELALVARDIARYGGRGLDVPEGLKLRRFSGTLVVGKGHDPAQDLARLMGLGLVRGAGRDGLVDTGGGGRR